MTAHPRLAGVIIAAVLAFLFLPVVLVVLFSFNAAASTSFPINGLTLRWYRETFADPAFGQALRNTVIVAVVSASIVVAVAVAAALALTRSTSRWATVVLAIAVTPSVLPGLVIGVALLSLFSEIGVQTSLLTVIAGHVIVTLPVALLIITARLARLDRSVEEAARDLGAGSTQAFLKIVFPAIRPAVLAAGLVSAAWSVDEFIVTNFLTGGDVTMPILIWGELRQGLDPSVNAMATLVLVGTMLTTLLGALLMSTRDLRR